MPRSFEGVKSKGDGVTSKWMVRKGPNDSMRAVKYETLVKRAQIIKVNGPEILRT